MCQEALDRLKKFKTTVSSELELQDALETLFTGLPFIREKVLSPKDRVDFLFEDGLAVEVKIDGTVNALLRQLVRYADNKVVKQILVVSTKSTQLVQLPESLNGKPILRFLVYSGF